MGKAAELAKQVLHGRSWDGTFASVRSEGSQVFVRAQAMPLRHPSGTIDGIVIVARQATGRSSQQERDRIGLLERIGERLARSLELGTTLRQVAEMLGMPTGARAVAHACATNPVSVAIPCHRVVGTKGDLRGYRWGLDRKQALITTEREHAPSTGARS